MNQALLLQNSVTVSLPIRVTKAYQGTKTMRAPPGVLKLRRTGRYWGRHAASAELMAIPPANQLVYRNHAVGLPPRIVRGQVRPKSAPVVCLSDSREGAENRGLANQTGDDSNKARFGRVGTKGYQGGGSCSIVEGTPSGIASFRLTSGGSSISTYTPVVPP